MQNKHKNKSMSKAKIAINGFGRIGRAFLKLAISRPELEVVAINDLGDLENLAYLLKYDSAYGRFENKIETREKDGKKYLVVGGKESLFIQEKNPEMLPWGALGVDIVVEATGIYEGFDKSSIHIKAGAKRVVLTAPAKDDDGPDGKTVLMGINEEDLSTCKITSNGSCTTNSVSPVMDILSEKLGVEKAFLNTIHGYTASQSLIDGPTKGKDYRRGRAAAVNIAPSTTGAAIAVTRVVHELKGKFDGMAMRVPIITGSISAVTFLAKRDTTSEEINKILEDAEKEPRWKWILRTTHDQIVSTDMIGEPCTAVVDLSLTKVVDGNLCAVYSWYDNEFGYTNTLVQHVLKIAELM